MWGKKDKEPESSVAPDAIPEPIEEPIADPEVIPNPDCAGCSGSGIIPQFTFTPDSESSEETLFTPDGIKQCDCFATYIPE